MLAQIIESLFAEARANNGRARTCLPRGLWLEADTRGPCRTLILSRRDGSPSPREAHICAKHAGFTHFGIANHQNKLVVFEQKEEV
ncbi:MAG: hypothetical protein K6T70_06065 [Meiothermus ruber]|nr:hypothetical protein [Meiothermus ruber]